VNSADLGRLSRTVMHLRPAQLGRRVQLRGQRVLLDRAGPIAGRWLLAGPDPVAGPGWPAGFTPIDAWLWSDGQTGKALRAGEARLLGVSRILARTSRSGDVCWAEADWTAAGAPLLWRFHLYYWDWVWALGGPVTEPDAAAVFTALWSSWHAAVVPGHGAAWHAYPAALRAWSFCGIFRQLVAGGPVEAPFRAELAAHAGYLRRNLETDVGGNHLVKNLKALAGLAVFFGDEDLLTRAVRRLSRQLAVQVLPDGGHYERAPAYHCQVLADLIDIDGLLRAAGCDEPAALAEAIVAMRAWLGSVLTPAGEVPLFNDGFPVHHELLSRIAPAEPSTGPLCVLRETGLARMTAGGWHVLADVGPPCPRELPAHAHADTLSCVVHLDGVPLLVDTGTSTYTAGPVRDRERSTGAHNTVELDGRDSTEVWGAFRAGRRARVTGLRTSADAGAVTVAAEHDGYRSLPGRPSHHRRWRVRGDELRVDDTVTGRGRHRVTVRWHLAPGAGLRLVSGGAVASTAGGELTVFVSASSEPAVTTTTAPVSVAFGEVVPAPVLACTLHCELPLTISTVWRRAEPSLESP
jgi:uncharacterized heparinase superfamily protein